MSVKRALALIEHANEVDRPRATTSGWPEGTAEEARRDAQALRMEAVVLAIAELLERLLPEELQSLRPGAQVRIKAPGRWANGHAGTIEEARVGRHIKVRLENGSVFPALDTEVEVIDA